MNVLNTFMLDEVVWSFFLAFRIMRGDRIRKNQKELRVCSLPGNIGYLVDMHRSVTKKSQIRCTFQFYRFIPKHIPNLLVSVTHSRSVT